MKLRAWVVFPLILLYLITAPALGARLLMHQRSVLEGRDGDLLTTISLPLWWWPLIVGPPTVLLALYFWQRFRASRS